MKTARRIRRFIEAELLDAPYEGADPLAAQILDSLAIEELITHLEETYRIRFQENEVVPENFVSVDALASLVDRKRRGT